jgi:hypothetical protein
MEKIADDPYNYTLYKKGEGLHMSVTCGTTAIFEVSFGLSSAETAAYAQQGSQYLSYLADQVRNDPDSYFNRA